MVKKERGIPELDLNYASFADSVAVTGQVSNFFLADLQELAKVANYFKTQKDGH